MIALLSAATLLTTACSKKKDDNPAPPPAASIEGYWVGKSGSGTGIEEKISMLFKPGGVVRIYAIENNMDTAALVGLAKTTGEWTRTGNTVQVSYKVSVSTITTEKVLNPNNTQMTGTWSKNGIVKGPIELNKQ